MNYCTANQNGQITIPAAIRKTNNINRDVIFEVFVDGEVICLRPLKSSTDSLVYAKIPKTKVKPPVFGGGKSRKNISENIDKIIYK